jgi:hypothetical protein
MEEEKRGDAAEERIPDDVFSSGDDEDEDAYDSRDAEDDSRDADENGGDDGDDTDDGDNRDEDLSGTTAPSIGPNTTFEKRPPEERLAEHDQSERDALGLDKRREVVGQSYGPSAGKQIRTYATFIAIAAAVIVGFILLASKLDQPPDKVEAKAPWAGSQQKAEGAGLSPEPKPVN